MRWTGPDGKELRDTLRARLKVQGVTYEAAGAQLGLTGEQVRKALKRYVSEETPAETGQATSLLTLLRREPMSIEQLSEAADRSVRTVSEWLDTLAREGYHIQTEQGKYWRDAVITPAETCVDHRATDTTLNIGIVADTHLNSKQQQLTFLNDFYDRCVDRRVRRVYHAGDLLAGVNVYPGQHSDILNHTEDEQIDYAVEYYPRREGIETCAIGGNHDLVFVKRGGSDPLKLIAARRPDIQYFGPFSAWVQLTPACVMYLLHPDGGISYADSYKLQKLIESFMGGKKPNVAVMGHWHKWLSIFTRNVYGMLGACFEGQTDYERRKAIMPQVGGTILEIKFDDHGAIQSYRPEFIAYLVPKERDWGYKVVRAA